MTATCAISPRVKDRGKASGCKAGPAVLLLLRPSVAAGTDFSPHVDQRFALRTLFVPRAPSRRSHRLGWRGGPLLLSRFIGPFHGALRMNTRGGVGTLAADNTDLAVFDQQRCWFLLIHHMNSSPACSDALRRYGKWPTGQTTCSGRRFDRTTANSAAQRPRVVERNG